MRRIALFRGKRVEIVWPIIKLHNQAQLPMQIKIGELLPHRVGSFLNLFAAPFLQSMDHIPIGSSGGNHRQMVQPGAVITEKLRIGTTVVFGGN